MKRLYQAFLIELHVLEEGLADTLLKALWVTGNRNHIERF